VSLLNSLLLVAALVVAAVLVVKREWVKQQAQQFAQFMREVKGEVEKITWPDKLQLRNATLVILAFVAVVALVIGAMDVVLQWLVVTLPARLT
jgi:preprotein translocase subunit SecE